MPPRPEPLSARIRRTQLRRWSWSIFLLFSLATASTMVWLEQDHAGKTRRAAASETAIRAAYEQRNGDVASEIHAAMRSQLPLAQSWETIHNQFPDLQLVSPLIDEQAPVSGSASGARQLHVFDPQTGTRYRLEQNSSSFHDSTLSHGPTFVQPAAPVWLAASIIRSNIRSSCLVAGVMLLSLWLVPSYRRLAGDLLLGAGIVFALTVVTNTRMRPLNDGLQALGFLLVSGLLKWFAHRQPKFDFSPRCLVCGYNLTGNTSGICPECGSPVAR